MIEVEIMSEEVKLIFTELESNISLIEGFRTEIATLKRDKALDKFNAWTDAEGTAKQKEDYVKSVVADIDREIRDKEAKIEYLYNKNAILNEKLVYLDE